jgi:hypothetical protein
MNEVFSSIVLRTNLQIIFKPTADAGHIHHILKKKNLPFVVCVFHASLRGVSVYFLLVLGVSLFYSSLVYLSTHYQMLHEQQQTTSIRSTVRETTHFLLVNIPCSHLHNFCATGVSGGLATRVTLTRVSRVKFWNYFTSGQNCFLFYFRTEVRGCWFALCSGRTWGSSASIVSDYRLDDRSSIPGRGTEFFL